MNSMSLHIITANLIYKMVTHNMTIGYIQIITTAVFNATNRSQSNIL